MRMESRRAALPRLRLCLTVALLGLSAVVATQIRPAAAEDFNGAEISVSGAFDLNVYFRKGSMYLTQTGAFDAFADNVGYNAVKLPLSGGKGCRKYRDGGRAGQHCYQVRKTTEGNWHIETTMRTAAGGGFESDSKKVALDLTVGPGESNCKAHVASYRRDYYGASSFRNEDLECVGGSASPRQGIIDILDRKYLR
jgi:hypothetical protein